MIFGAFRSLTRRKGTGEAVGELRAWLFHVIKHVLVPLHSIALIWPSEWERIQKLFVVDHVIKITRTAAPGADPEGALYTSEPRECMFCCSLGSVLCQLSGQWAKGSHLRGWVVNVELGGCSELLGWDLQGAEAMKCILSLSLPRALSGVQRRAVVPTAAGLA